MICAVSVNYTLDIEDMVQKMNVKIFNSGKREHREGEIGKGSQICGNGKKADFGWGACN